MKQVTIEYATEESGWDYWFSCKVPYPFTIEDDSEDIAAMCAEDYFNNHDGWESSWPLEFRIRDAGDIVAPVSVVVEREYNPVFTGSIKRTEK